jgi:hypothetical protein
MHPLAALTHAGVLERSGAPRSTLRVAPRFLAHAERLASRRRTLGLPAVPDEVLEAALATWDDYAQDTRAGARVLARLLEERGQLGALHRAFPPLERFAQAAA